MKKNEQLKILLVFEIWMCLSIFTMMLLKIIFEEYVHIINQVMIYTSALSLSTIAVFLVFLIVKNNKKKTNAEKSILE